MNYAKVMYHAGYVIGLLKVTKLKKLIISVIYRSIQYNFELELYLVTISDAENQRISSKRPCMFLSVETHSHGNLLGYLIKITVIGISY